MSRLPGSSAAKRKRPGPDLSRTLTDDDRKVLNVIKSKGNLGILQKEIEIEAKLTYTVAKKVLKTLADNKLIKEVPNIRNKGRKLYMAVEFEPSKEVTGGDWYLEGHLDKELIAVLRNLCSRVLRAKKVGTAEDIHVALKKSKVITFDLKEQQVAEILNSMVLDDDIMEVKSTGFGEYHSIPVGAVCYRMAGGDKAPTMGKMASIPCGSCPRISQCTPDGVISPSTCVYYTKWLDINF